MTSTFAKA